MNDNFLQSIIAAPDDDAPRLVYADWLIEECQPAQPERGEFIKIQVEIARIDKQLDTTMETETPITDGLPLFKKREALRRRERELLENNWLSWFGKEFRRLLKIATVFDLGCNAHNFGFTIGAAYDYRQPANGREIWFTPRRGFVSAITCAWADWLTHHAAIRAATPLREVTLTSWPLVHESWTSGELSLCDFGSPYGEWRLFTELGLDNDLMRPRVLQLLADQFKGITFHLPPVRVHQNVPVEMIH